MAASPGGQSEHGDRISCLWPQLMRVLSAVSPLAPLSRLPRAIHWRHVVTRHHHGVKRVDTAPNLSDAEELVQKAQIALRVLTKAGSTTRISTNMN